MGDRKPKKTSSGNSDAHKAQQAKSSTPRPPDLKSTDKKGSDKK